MLDVQLAGAGAGHTGVAILAGPGGPVLVPQLTWHPPAELGVAILAGPGGPVLELGLTMWGLSGALLRSSPAPEGRCW